MARQNIKPNPAEKLFEAYMDFSGGVNMKTSNEKLRDNEYIVMENVDLSGRGSAKRRTGRIKITGISGNGQMVHPYFRQFQTEPDLIFAISGKLYVKEWDKNTLTQVPITQNGSAFTFQTTLPIEAVQYRDDLLVATGTKLVELTYDNGWKAKVMEPYKPTVMEVIHIGTNAIADSPSTWIQEKDGAVVSIEGITASSPVGAVNSPIRFTAHTVKPSNVEVDYRFSTRKTGAGSFSQVYSGPNRFADISFNDVGGYDIKAETTQKVFIIDDMEQNILWTAAPGIKIQASTGAYDGSGGYQTKCLIIQTGGTGTYDNTKPAVYRDYATPLDISKVDTFKFAFSVWNYDQMGGSGSKDKNQLWFYTEGNLDTPVLKVDSTTYFGKAEGGPLWNYAETKFDNKIPGLDKIVRIGFKCFVGSGYVPRTEANYSTYDTREDSCTRLDDISMWLSTSNSSYTLSDYQVGGVIDPTIDPETYSAIHTSRMIRLHWNRIILGKDNKYPGQLYISDLNNPRYFPTNKRIDFSLDRKEPISSVVRFQDMLVIFTKTTINTLTGKHPQDGDIPVPDSYRVSLINDTLGCIADRSAKVVGNDIIFLSNEGIQMLRPNPYRLESLNVKRVDYPVESLVVRDVDSCSLVYDNQYWICFPSQKTILRLDYSSGTWVVDKSSKLNIAQFYQYGSDVYNLTKDGNLYKHDSSVYNDCGEVYEMKIESKMLDLSASFNFKKLRRMYILFGTSQKENVALTVRAYADSALANPETKGKAVVNEDGSVTWEASTELPNLNFYKGTIFGKWLMGLSAFGEIQATVSKISVTGKCRRVKVTYNHKEDKLCEVFGFGLEFKMKKP